MTSSTNKRKEIEASHIHFNNLETKLKLLYHNRAMTRNILDAHQDIKSQFIDNLESMGLTGRSGTKGRRVKRFLPMQPWIGRIVGSTVRICVWGLLWQASRITAARWEEVKSIGDQVSENVNRFADRRLVKPIYRYSHDILLSYVNSFVLFIYYYYCYC